MDDRPQDGPEDRRRRGPLGDEEDAEETTRRAPQARDDDTTRRIPPGVDERETARTPDSERTSPGTPREEDPETRVIRTPGGREDEPYPRSYMEAVDQREARLREVYGGVDWLASFIGGVCALVCGGVLLSLASLALDQLGFTLDFANRETDAAIIAGLVIIGLVLFIAYFCGGYVSGRLARFDGGRNGAATVLWGILLSFIIALFGSLVPGPLFGSLEEFVTSSILPAIGGLMQTGAGVWFGLGALLLELLGGFLGGRLGNSYHARIDYTT